MRLLLIFLIAASTLVAGHVRAQNGGLRGQMDQVFGSMSTVTAPDYNMGTRRGVLSGGSIVVRNRVMSEQPFNLTLPRWGGGCSGIDFYGGSLSFISKRQFEALLRSIASNASGYAFELGMNALCPQCAQEMARLQKIIQDMSGKMLDSCMAAKKLVNMTSLDELNERRAEDASWMSTSIGRFSSTLEKYTSYDGRNQAAVLAHDRPELARNLRYNVHWTSLKKSGIAGWFAGASEQELYEDLLSVTGFVLVVNPGDSDECPDATEVSGAQAQPCVLYKPATVSLRDLIFGTGSTSSGGRSDPQFYRCDDDECLRFHMESVEYSGLAEKIRRAYVGDGTSPGIIEKMGSMNGGLMQPELFFLENSGSMGTIVRNLVAFRETDAARMMANDGAPRIGTAMVFNIVFQSMKGVRHALANGQVPETAMALANLDKRLFELSEERKSIDSEASVNDSNLAYYNAIMRSRPPSYLPSLDLGQKTSATARSAN